MELFAIHCTTCRARLKVTDPSVIGQILSCPKCESMVMIEPPAGWNHSPVASAATIAISKQPTVRVPEKTATSPPPLPQQVAAPARLVPPAASAAVAPQLAMPAAEVSVTPVKTPAVPRDWLVFGGGIAAGVVIGAAVWLLVAMRDSGSTSVATAEANAAIVEPLQSVEARESLPVDETNVNEPTPKDAAEESTAVETMKPVLEEPADAQPVEEEVVADTDSPVTAEEEVEADISEAEPVEDPLVSSGTEEPVPAEEHSPADEVPVEPAAVDAAVTESTGPASDPLVDRLNVMLPKVAFDKVPLRQFIAFAAEASGARITIDYASLKKAGFKSPVITVRASDLPLWKVLEESLDKVGLKYEAREGAIVVFAP